MARLTSLSVLLDPTGKDFLAEQYGKVIENIEKTTISARLKNKDLSGDPTTGSVEAKRFENAQSSAYGTARTAGKGANVTAKPVVVQINVDKEIVEELEEKDVKLYGVDGVIQRRVANHQKSMTRELERAFFAEAVTAGTALTTSETEINKIVEALVQSIETVKNDYVDGVDRDMIEVTCDTATYGELRDFLDGKQNANVDTGVGEFGMFHGVKVSSSVYLPTGTKMVAQVIGSVAQPVMTNIMNPEKIQLSNAYGFGIFYSYGTEAVMPDLIFKVTA